MQQITRGDYLEDLITIYVDNSLQTSLTDLYEKFIFQCGDIQKIFAPAQIIKISFNEQESQLLKTTNTCYLAGITTDGHKETFNGSLSFNTRGEVVYYEPSTITPSTTTAETTCGCQGLRGFFSNCSQPAIKAYFSLNYVPTKLSELQNDTDFQDGQDVAESISIHNASTEAHPYIQSLIADNTQAIEYEASVRATETEALEVMIHNEESVRASQTEALSVSIGAETTARDEAVSLAIQTTEAYTDTQLAGATTAINTTIGTLSSLNTSTTSSIVGAINSEVSDRQSADNNLQGQIDAIVASSDVTDIVGTYAELEAYDTSHLGNNDIIKVLSDSTHNGAPSYYRFDKDTDTFSYIGSESASYTKAQSDSIFVTQTTEINGHALSSDINLTPSDIGALADSYATVISANTSAIAANTTAIASNTSDISTINGKIPTDASTSNKLVSASTLAASIADFSNKDLSNLTSTGEARLHALKSYADEGELLTDADGLAFVEKYAHSTFDSSKFTVVGSPTITSDGIASGFSTSNYITASVSIDFTKIWKVQGEFTTGDTVSAQNIVSLDGQISPVYYLVITGTGQLSFRFNNGQIINSTFALLSNKTYSYEVGWDKTKLYLRIGLKGNSLTEFKLDTTTGFVLSSSSSILIGTTNSFPFLGSIDLKQFSITVDGVQVFSGNKTGIDTIKPDDYTIVGSPSISTDGIASGFAGAVVYSSVTAAYLKTILNITPTKEIKIKSRQIIENLDRTNIVWALDDGGVTRIQFSQNGKIYLQSSLVTSCDSDTTYSYSNNDIIDTETTIAASSINIKFYKNGTIMYDKSFDRSYAFANISNVYIGTYYNDTAIQGKLDLNSFKIYVDGNLVYQPCLKIPYTESKTGSKVVNSIYRDRVNDMAEQFGYAPYYTLLEEDTPHYTVVGSPTISSDFVASGFSSSSYIKTGTINLSGNFKVQGKFKYTSASSANSIFAFGNKNFYVAVSNANKILMWASSDGSSWDIANVTSTNALQTNTDYDIEFGFTGAKYYVNINGVEYASSSSTASIYNISNADISFGWWTASTSLVLTGALYLKDCKIYVDNKLAYQAVEPPDYTLPQGEVYGLIQRQNFAPSDKYDNLTLGASGSTYTAPADGWFYLKKVAGGTDKYSLMEISNGIGSLCFVPETNNVTRCILPVKKNDVVNVSYSATGATNIFRFIYSVGSESEAK